MVYRIAEAWTATAAQIEAGLEKAVFVECGATQAQSSGWAPPRGEAHGALVEDVGGHYLLKLMVEQRVLPGAVVKKKVDEIAAQVEQQTGRKPGKKALKDLKEQATLELLPMAFTKQSAIRVWIAPAQHLLMIDASSANRAE